MSPPVEVVAPADFSGPSPSPGMLSPYKCHPPFPVRIFALLLAVITGDFLSDTPFFP